MSARTNGLTLAPIARRVSFCTQFQISTVSYVFPHFISRFSFYRFDHLDINNKALTFTSQGAFLKKNYFGKDEESEETVLLKSILLQNILINLRTYDTHSLILYANDHLNNFAHLYISNGTSIVYLFNAGNEIKNITVEYPGN